MSRKTFTTDSGIPVKRVYTPREASRISYREDLNDPGRYPFTRGIYPTMYRERLWTMRQYTGFGSAEETNKRFKYLIAQGQTGLSIAFDLPTQLGLDSDSDRAAGEVGRVGVPVSSLKDMETLLAGIPLGKISTSMTINATAPILLAMYVAVAEKQGVAYDQVRGTTQNDILKEYVARNTFIYPPKESLRLVVDLIEYSVKNLPKWYPISISGYHMREAGANAVQEVAFTLCDALEYLGSCIGRGLSVDDVAPALSFFFACRNDFFEEIAKFRAARRTWARLVRKKYDGSDESCRMKFHVQTSGETLTAQQPDNNIVRVSLQALAAVLGGTQSLHTNSRDEALSLPSEESVKIALRTQQIIACESGVARAVDPLAGSYYVEYLTQELDERIRKEIGQVMKMGGALAAIEKGYIQRAIRDSAYKHQLRVERGDEVVVGVNRFAEEGGLRLKLHRIPKEAERRQIERLKRVKEDRDRAKVRRALGRLEEAAEEGANVMPMVVDAVKTYATVQEISDVFRKTLGEELRSSMI